MIGVPLVESVPESLSRKFWAMDGSASRLAYFDLGNPAAVVMRAVLLIASTTVQSLNDC